MNAPTIRMVHKTNGRAPLTMAGSEMRIEKMRVTPDLARKWLGLNTQSNRNVSKRTVEAYATEMAAGRWLLTHQGIAFNQTGELVDGQHRLHAIVLSATAVEMMVTTGLQVEYNSPLDQGYNRSIGHLTGKGTRWVSVVRGLMAMEAGLANVSFKSTVGAVEACAERHADAITTVMTVAKNARACPTGLVAALAYAYPVNHDKVMSFARQLETGELLERGDPALHLRRWIAQGRHTPRETILATLSAAKAVLQGKPLTKITSGANGGERDGSHSFVWFTQRRRALKVPGTPTIDVVAST